jgi:hypothetical protein
MPPDSGPLLPPTANPLALPIPIPTLPMPPQVGAVPEEGEPPSERENLEAELEVAVLEETRHRELALDRRLGTLERLAESFVVPEEQVECDEHRKEFGERFIKEPLGGYYVDKSRITQREVQLAYREAVPHPALYWIAGKTGEKADLAQWALKNKKWRQLYQFGEVEQDDLVGADHLRDLK